MTHFSPRSNLVSWGFEWRKGETLHFSKTVVVCDIKESALCTSLNTKAQGYSMTLAKGQQE